MGYWRTVWAVSRRPARIAQRLESEAAVAEAVRFRRITVAIGCAGLLALVVMIWAGMRVWPGQDSLFPRLSTRAVVRAVGAWPMWSVLYREAGLVPPVALGVGVVLFFLAGSAAPGVVLSRCRVGAAGDARAEAAAYYACGSLAWLALCPVLYVGALVVEPFLPTVANVLFLAAVLGPVGIILLWLCDLVHLASRCVGMGAVSALGAGVRVAGVWCAAFVCFLVLIPLLALMDTAMLITLAGR